MKDDGRALSSIDQNRETGEVKPSPTWWISFSHLGTRPPAADQFRKGANAVKLLKGKLADLGAGQYTRAISALPGSQNIQQTARYIGLSTQQFKAFWKD